MPSKAFLVGLAALGVAGPALAQTPSAPAPKCDVTVQSRAGGALQVAPSPQAKGATGPQLIWQPIASGPGIQLLVIYPAGGLTRMDEPNGVLIRFRTQNNRGTDGLSVVVATRGRAWRFDPPTVVADSSESAHVAFGLDWPYGRGMLSAIADNQPLTVSVEQDGQSLASDSFGLSNIEARETLLAAARAKYQTIPADCAASP